MANAKKLTEAQIAALRAAARENCHFRPRPTRDGFRQNSIDALRKRGLIGAYRDGAYQITPAGRAALFEATGENTAATDPRPYVRARLGAGLQANGRPQGHGGGCRCHECKLTEGP